MFRTYLPASIVLMAQLVSPASPQDSARLDDGLRPAPYWIGVQCAQLDDPAKSIQITRTVAEAPAAKAGIRVGDQIVAVNGETPRSVDDLVRLIQKSEGGELRISIKRDEVESIVKLSPIRRRASTYAWPELRAHDLAEWMRKEARNGENSGIDMTFINPGVVLERSGPRFPANTTFTLERTTDGPVALTIRRAEQEWSVTGQELDKLPEDLRPWAARLLNMANSRMPQLPPDIHLLLPAPLHPFSPVRPPSDAELSDDQPSGDQPSTERSELHRRLDDLIRQMEALRKAVERE